ncbi:MAG: hypothetical protein KGD64_01315 [Candidatus Heimdallarchaeota archaeon]|nr:hypothetical protein [Candidatus Heimdallarchaeota archaeon]
MFVISFIKKNKKFLLSQLPQLIFLLFLIFLVLIVGASNKTRLSVFASKNVSSDISGYISLSNNEEISLLSLWEEEVWSHNNGDIDKLRGGIAFPITHLNSSLEINSTNIYSSTIIIFTDDIISVPYNETYVYGTLFSENNITEGFSLNLTTIALTEEEEIQQSNLLLPIGKEITQLPEFVSAELYNPALQNFIFLNPTHLNEYLNNLTLSEINMQVLYLFGCLFSYDFKNSFDVKAKLDSFITSTQLLLNTTYEGTFIDQPIISWSTADFLNRISALVSMLKADLVFYGLVTIPLFLLLVIVIYQSKDLTFGYFEQFIEKLDEKGYPQSKVYSLFSRIFFVFNILLAIIGLILITLISFIFTFDSFSIFYLSSILLCCWILFNLTFQLITFRSELKKFYVKREDSLEAISRRIGWKHDLIKFLFKGVIFGIVCLVFFLLHLVFSFNESILSWIYLVCGITGVMMFHSSLEKLLGYIMTFFSHFALVRMGRRIFKDTGMIFYKLFKRGNSYKNFEYTSLLLLFLVAPSILIAADSYKYYVHEQHYNSLCGDMVLENITPEVLEFLQDNFSQEQLLPLMKWTTLANITYFFSFPNQYADFIEYSWIEGKPFSNVDERVLENVRILEQNSSKIIISESLSESLDLSFNDTVVFYPPSNDELILSTSNVTSISYSISSVIELLPYLSTLSDLWVFGMLELEPGSAVVFNKEKINTVCIKINNQELIDDSKLIISTLFPFVEIKLLNDPEAINSMYPVPYIHFQQLILLELIISFLMLELFYIQLINLIFYQRKLSLFQLFSKGINPKHLFLSFSLSVSTRILVLAVVSIPFMFIFSSGLIGLLTRSSNVSSISTVFSLSSFIFLICFIIISITLNIIIVYYDLRKTFNRADKYLGELHE